MKKKLADNKDKFLMVLSPNYRWLAFIYLAIWVGLIIWGYFEHVPWKLYLLFIPFVALGLLLILFTYSWFWSITVDGDHITMTKAIFYKRHYRFSEIVKCKSVRSGIGGLQVYVQDRKRKAFFVDFYWRNSTLFTQRVEDANIPIEERRSANKRK